MPSAASAEASPLWTAMGWMAPSERATSAARSPALTRAAANPPTVGMAQAVPARSRATRARPSRGGRSEARSAPCRNARAITSASRVAWAISRPVLARPRSTAARRATRVARAWRQSQGWIGPRIESIALGEILPTDPSTEDPVGPPLVEEHQRGEDGGDDAHHAQRVRARRGVEDREVIGRTQAGDHDPGIEVEEDRGHQKDDGGRGGDEAPSEPALSEQ